MTISEHRIIRYINLLMVFYFHRVFRIAVLDNEGDNNSDCEGLITKETTTCTAFSTEGRNAPNVMETSATSTEENQFGENANIFQFMQFTAEKPVLKKYSIRLYFYPNIEFDIPIQYQKLIYFLYYLCIFHAIVNFTNLVGGFIIMDMTVIIFSFFYNLFCLFYSFMGWYRCAYIAFSTGSTYYFLTFLYTFFLQFLMILVQSLGVPNSGTLGIITALNEAPNMENLHVTIGTIVACACWSVAVLDLLIMAMISKLNNQISAFFIQKGIEKSKKASIINKIV